MDQSDIAMDELSPFFAPVPVRKAIQTGRVRHFRKFRSEQGAHFRGKTTKDIDLYLFRFGCRVRPQGDTSRAGQGDR